MVFKKVISLLLMSVIFFTSRMSVQAITADRLVNEYPHVSSISITSDSVFRIRQLVDKLLQKNIHRNHPGVMLVEDVNKVLWFKGMEISTLSRTMPYLDQSARTSLSAFLKKEVTDYLFNAQYREFELKGDLSTKMGTLPANLSWWQWGGVEWETLYGLWAYAHYTGDWDSISQQWSTISSIYSSARTEHKKFIAEGKYIQSRNSEIAGRIAFARMAKKLASVTGQSSYQSTYQSAVSALNSRLSILSDQASNGSFDDQICGFAVTDLCSPSRSSNRDIQIYFAQYDFLVPEVGRYMHDTFLTQANSVVGSATTQTPWWYLASYNLQHTGGEGYYPAPNFAYQLYQAKSLILDQETAVLKKELPWPTDLASVPVEWDILHYANILSYIQSSEPTLVWNDILTPPSPVNIGQMSPVPTSQPLPTNPVTPTSSTCAGDFNRDGIVDIADYSIFVSNFFEDQLSHPETDMNQDGIVDITDYSLFVRRFFESC